MRKTFIIAAAALAAVAAVPSSAVRADPYKWCAIYAGPGGDSGTNCGFVTLAQCRETISGIGGVCVLNQRYTGDPRSRRPRRHYD